MTRISQNNYIVCSFTLYCIALHLLPSQLVCVIKLLITVQLQKKKVAMTAITIVKTLSLFYFFFLFYIDKSVNSPLFPWCMYAFLFHFYYFAQLVQKLHLNIDHCPGFPLIFMIRKKNLAFCRNMSLVMVPVYVLWRSWKNKTKQTRAHTQDSFCSDYPFIF